MDWSFLSQPLIDSWLNPNLPDTAISVAVTVVFAIITRTMWKKDSLISAIIGLVAIVLAAYAAVCALSGLLGLLAIAFDNAAPGFVGWLRGL